MAGDWRIMSNEQTNQILKERAIAKLVALGLTEAELRSLGLTSDAN
jgi:hypothetical protein